MRALPFFSRHSFFTFIYYSLPILTILTWWICAFKPKENSHQPLALKKQETQEPPSIIKYLSVLQRELLHSALTGNHELMIKLITDWDHDAQIMEQFGFNQVKRLSKKDFLRCQLLARQILNSSPYELQLLHDFHRLPEIKDDQGTLFDLSVSYKKFLPQSYVAASFLLALSEPDAIVALPKGMRNQKNIYPQKITDAIPLDTSRYHTEKLYEAKPEIAFVADYSDPSTIAALQKQGITLFTLKHINSPEDIRNALLRIGHVANRPIEAELLYYFVEAAMQAIDNRFKILNASFQSFSQQPNVLFLKHNLTFSTPTNQTLTGKLLKRLGIKLLTEDHFDNHFTWTIPIHMEKILEINPDYIIVGSGNIEASKNYVLKEPLFNEMINQHKQISFVDNDIQENPSQYIVLAYYDLFQALTSSDIKL